MKKTICVCVLLVATMGCRQIYNGCVFNKLAESACIANSTISPDLSNANVTGEQGKEFPFDIGRGAKIQAVPVP